eukprot:5886140-Prymnesium_polylepis.1
MAAMKPTSMNSASVIVVMATPSTTGITLAYCRVLIRSCANARREEGREGGDTREGDERRIVRCCGVRALSSAPNARPDGDGCAGAGVGALVPVCGQRARACSMMREKKM